jgi:hypothetical protein
MGLGKGQNLNWFPNLINLLAPKSIEIGIITGFSQIIL